MAATNAHHRLLAGNQKGRSGLRTRSVHSELLLCLSTGRSIDSALASMGLKEETTGVIICSFGGEAPVREAVQLLLRADEDSAAPVAVGWEELEARAVTRRAAFSK